MGGGDFQTGSTEVRVLYSCGPLGHAGRWCAPCPQHVSLATLRWTRNRSPVGLKDAVWYYEVPSRVLY